MGSAFSKSFFSNMGVKQGCQISFALFSLAEIVNNVAKAEMLDEPKITHELIFIFIYAYHVVLFAILWMICNT